MAGGGARPGSGRPMKRANRLALQLLGPIERGLELAGVAKGLAPSPELAAEVQARIVSDHILAGQGFEVLRLKAQLLATVAARDPGDDDEADTGSPLIRALSSCPGMPAPGTHPARPAAEFLPAPRPTRDPEDGPTEQQSVVPDSREPRAFFFQPQTALDLDEPAPAAAAPAAPAHAPDPPAAPPRAEIDPHAENFEKYQPEDADDASLRQAVAF